jgi:hypothetical protein
MSLNLYDQNKFEYFVSRPKMLFLASIGAACITLGSWAIIEGFFNLDMRMIYDPSRLIFSVFVVVLLCLIARWTIAMTRKAFDRREQVVIDDKGVLWRDGRVGLVPWSEVSRAELGSYGGTGGPSCRLSLTLRSPENGSARILGGPKLSRT